jgi:hypothetical protein
VYWSHEAKVVPSHKPDILAQLVACRDPQGWQTASPHPTHIAQIVTGTLVEDFPWWEQAQIRQQPMNPHWPWPPWCARDIQPTGVVILLAVCQKGVDTTNQFLYYLLSIVNELLIQMLLGPTHADGWVENLSNTAIRAEMRILKADDSPIATI